MAQNDKFVGVGKNPHGPDLPLGFGMSLAQHPKALDEYGRLSDGEKASVIAYIQDGNTGGEAKARIDKAVEQLENGGFGAGLL